MTQTMVYQALAPITIGKAKLEDVGKTIDGIRATHPNGFCSPEAYVDAARPVESPIHDTLPWDDATVAEAARRAIARHIIQVVVKIEKPDSPVPPRNVSVSFINATGDVERGYMPVVEVIKVESYERQVEREMLAHIKGYLRNHSWLPIARQILTQVQEIERESQSEEIGNAA